MLWTSPRDQWNTWLAQNGTVDFVTLSNSCLTHTAAVLNLSMLRRSQHVVFNLVWWLPTLLFLFALTCVQDSARNYCFYYRVLITTNVGLSMILWHRHIVYKLSPWYCLLILVHNALKQNFPLQRVMTKKKGTAKEKDTSTDVPITGIWPLEAGPPMCGAWLPNFRSNAWLQLDSS